MVPIAAGGPYRSVRAALNHPPESDRADRAVVACTSWAKCHLLPPDEGGATANAGEDLIASDRTIIRVDQRADRHHMTTRAMQRLASRYVGLTPLAILRRCRLHGAAQQLRDDPSLTIAHIAAGLGYADLAHLSAGFRRSLSLSPSFFRRGTTRTRQSSAWPNLLWVDDRIDQEPGSTPAAGRPRLCG